MLSIINAVLTIVQIASTIAVNVVDVMKKVREWRDGRKTREAGSRPPASK
jgi:hypothetical protein